MHLLIPFAASQSEGCQSALAGLKLPNLQKLLTRLQALPLDMGDERSLTPPHERALARAEGLPLADGLVPWAAWQAKRSSESAWAFISLCHWRVGTHHVLMSQLPLPDFTAQESSELMLAMQPYFEEDGITLYEDQPGRWLAHGEIFGDLPSASLDRVIGRHVKPWLPTGVKATALLRLQNEMQMLLYTHPVNDAREAIGLTPANSFWIHGTGKLNRSPEPVLIDPLAQLTPSLPDAKPAIVITTLRYAALAENWPTWARIWQEIDACEGPALLRAQSRGEPLTLTLCGERNAQSWVAKRRSIVQKINSIFDRQSISGVLGQL